MSNNHVGWEFMALDPCTSGITRHNIREKDAGKYKMNLMDANFEQQEYSPPVYVTVLKGNYMYMKYVSQI